MFIGVKTTTLEQFQMFWLACCALGSLCFLSTSLKYAKPSETDGSRLLLVCDVALGVSKDLYKRDQTLTEAPEGYHSVHGVRRTNKTTSDFEVGTEELHIHRMFSMLKLCCTLRKLIAVF